MERLWERSRDERKGTNRKAEYAEPREANGKPVVRNGEDPEGAKARAGALGKPLGGGTDGGLKGRTGS